MTPAPFIGAFSNGFRGGQWKAWFGLPAEYRLFANESDVINALLWALTVFWCTADWQLALASALAMFVGAVPGWGDYIGNLMRYIMGEPFDDPELEENTYIDPLIRWLKPYPAAWAFAGLALRGLWWGFCLAVPFYIFGRHDTAYNFLTIGPYMPWAYMAAGYWLKTRIRGSNSGDAWGLGEIFWGVVLWSPLS